MKIETFLRRIKAAQCLQGRRRLFGRGVKGLVVFLAFGFVLSMLISGHSTTPELRLDPIWDPLRADPAF